MPVAGYTDTIFGVFHLLAFQFSPRIADIGGQKQEAERRVSAAATGVALLEAAKVMRSHPEPAAG